MIHDYPVKRRTLEQIERIADDLRKQLKVGDAVRFDVFKILFEDMPDYLKIRNLTMVARSAGYMGDRDAYAVSRPNRIFYRPRLLAELKVGVKKAKMIFLHELAHILLHPGAEKAWVTAGNDTPRFIPEHESAEWQATTLALCLMAPKKLTETCQSAHELSEKFDIDVEFAERRFNQITRNKPRKLPAIYHDVRRELVRARQQQTYLDERCTDCGECRLIRIDNKYRCANCGRVSDHFQDGDLVGDFH